jgi:hypothetical protein
MIPARDDEQGKSEHEQHLPLTPELIATINGQQPSVLKAKHVSILKRLAKSRQDVDLLVEIRGGRVRRIRHTINDYVDNTTEEQTSHAED